jgi:hypothetical protein
MPVFCLGLMCSSQQHYLLPANRLWHGTSIFAAIIERASSKDRYKWQSVIRVMTKSILTPFANFLPLLC